MTVRNGPTDVSVFSRDTVLPLAIRLITKHGKSGKRSLAALRMPIRRKIRKILPRKGKMWRQVPMRAAFPRRKWKRQRWMPMVIRCSRCPGL